MITVYIWISALISCLVKRNPPHQYAKYTFRDIPSLLDLFSFGKSICLYHGLLPHAYPAAWFPPLESDTVGSWAHESGFQVHRCLRGSGEDDWFALFCHPSVSVQLHYVLFPSLPTRRNLLLAWIMSTDEMWSMLFPWRRDEVIKSIMSSTKPIGSSSYLRHWFLQIRWIRRIMGRKDCGYISHSNKNPASSLSMLQSDRQWYCFHCLLPTGFY